MDKTVVAILVLTVGIVGALAIFSSKTNPNSTEASAPRNQCISGDFGLAMHIHPHLSILVDNQPVTIPENIGISQTCTKTLHTHDANGIIHVESPVKYDYTLGDFFAVWGQPFSKTSLLDKQVDDNHTLTMTVNGQPSDAFGSLVLKDKQEIVLSYQSKNTPASLAPTATPPSSN